MARAPTIGLRGLDLNQRPLGYELVQPSRITDIYEPPMCRSWHRAAGNATPAQPTRLPSGGTELRTFQVSHGSPCRDGLGLSLERLESLIKSRGPVLNRPSPPVEDLRVTDR